MWLFVTCLCFSEVRARRDTHAREKREVTKSFLQTCLPSWSWECALASRSSKGLVSRLELTKRSFKSSHHSTFKVSARLELELETTALVHRNLSERERCTRTAPVEGGCRCRPSSAGFTHIAGNHKEANVQSFSLFCTVFSNYHPLPFQSPSSI